MRDGTCVRLYEEGGREPAALPGARFVVVVVVLAVAAVDGREGGSPGSPAGPVAAGGALACVSSGRSDMADDMTLIACPPLPLGTAKPVGKE